jgi:hypothetical protein
MEHPRHVAAAVRAVHGDLAAKRLSSHRRSRTNEVGDSRLVADEWTPIEIVERTVPPGGNQGNVTLVFRLSTEPDRLWTEAFLRFSWNIAGGLSLIARPTLHPSVYQNRVVWEVPDPMVEDAARQVGEAVAVANADYGQSIGGPRLEQERQDWEAAAHEDEMRVARPNDPE